MKTSNLDEVTRKAYNQYMRTYRANNKSRIEAINARYWTKKVAAMQLDSEKVDNSSGQLSDKV